MAEPGGGGCCRCCFSFILTSGLTVLFMWLSLRTSNPVFSIQNFYVPALNKTANSTGNTSIYFDLKLDNKNKDKGIYYDTLNLTFYYPHDTQIAAQSFPNFYQGHQKKTDRTQMLETRGVPWKEVVAAVNNGSPAIFRVHLATAVRFKIMAWKTKKHGLEVGANVTVNESGNKVSKKNKGIKLTSGAPERRCYRARLGPFIVVFTILNLSIFI